MAKPRSLLAATLIVALCAATIALLGAAPQASASAKCTWWTTVTAGGWQTSGSHAAISGVSCHQARTVVRAYLARKVGHENEPCARRADDPPFRGCVVDGYRCRATHVASLQRLFVPELCTDGRRRIAFDEVDHRSF